LMSFGVDGVNVFQGMHNWVTCQIQGKFPPPTWKPFIAWHRSQ
jgi:hypothetical protein